MSAFRYTDPDQFTQLLEWISRIQRSAAHGRVTSDKVIEIRTGGLDEEVSITLGSFIVRSPERSQQGWIVYSEDAFYTRYEALPAEMPVHPDGEVIGV